MAALITAAGVLGSPADAPLAAVASQAQGTGQGGRGNAPAPDPTKPHKLEIAAGTRARYRVQEQLAGINFPSEAVGTTETVSGAIIVNPDGSFAPESKIIVDLRTLSSDQSLRDNYIRTRTLETEKFPNLELAPKRAVGLPSPLPAGGQAQAGFQLVADMTLRGVTKETTWNVVATFGPATVGGRATTTIDFATFNLTKPSLARLLSVDDKIHLEIEFRSTRTAVQAPSLR
jgi:polyisoprenoid-binding protein YceI